MRELQNRSRRHNSGESTEGRAGSAQKYTAKVIANFNNGSYYISSFSVNFTVPSAPTIGTATALDASATVAYTAGTKGGIATTYRALSSPGSIVGTSATSPITVSGLTNGTAYTFQVRAENSTGNSAYSSASNSVTLASASSYESIATVTVGSGGTSSISFTSIPQTYKHLQIRGIGKTDRAAGTVTELQVEINSDTTSNYYTHELMGNGSSVIPSAQTSTAIKYFSWSRLASADTSVFSANIIDFLDYANTSKYKTARHLGGVDGNGFGNIILNSGMIANTAAISSIKITPGYGSTTLLQYTSFALYGIKG
jgi:hypothetical protein